MWYLNVQRSAFNVSRLGHTLRHIGFWRQRMYWLEHLRESKVRLLESLFVFSLFHPFQYSTSVSHTAIANPIPDTISCYTLASSTRLISLGSRWLYSKCCIPTFFNWPLRRLLERPIFGRLGPTAGPRRKQRTPGVRVECTGGFYFNILVTEYQPLGNICYFQNLPTIHLHPVRCVAEAETLISRVASIRGQTCCSISLCGGAGVCNPSEGGEFLVDVACKRGESVERVHMESYVFGGKAFCRATNMFFMILKGISRVLVFWCQLIKRTRISRNRPLTKC